MFNVITQRTTLLPRPDGLARMTDRHTYRYRKTNLSHKGISRTQDEQREEERERSAMVFRITTDSRWRILVKHVHRIIRSHSAPAPYYVWVYGAHRAGSTHPRHSDGHFIQFSNWEKSNKQCERRASEPWRTRINMTWKRKHKICVTCRLTLMMSLATVVRHVSACVQQNEEKLSDHRVLAVGYGEEP